MTKLPFEDALPSPLTDEEWAEREQRIARERQREEERAQRKRLDSFRSEVLRRGLSARHVDHLLQRAPIDIETPAMKAARSMKSGQTVVLAGNVGCGKTFAAHVWLMNLEPTKWDLRLASTVYMTTAASFARQSRYTDKIDKLATPKRFVLDDLGVEYLDDKGSFVTDLDELVDLRWRAGLSTLITTNLKADDFKARYGARIVDRIRDCGGWKNVGRESMRNG